MPAITRFRCVVCGKMTAGRQPYGENTIILPRTHRINGEICRGSYYEADMVDVDEHGKEVGNVILAPHAPKSY